MSRFRIIDRLAIKFASAILSACFAHMLEDRFAAGRRSWLCRALFDSWTAKLLLSRTASLATASIARGRVNGRRHRIDRANSRSR